MDKIGVGIIGATPNRGWAETAHIPALRALPQYELRAISTSRRASADEASRKFNVRLAFDNHADLVARPEVDLVVVSVRVPHHFELVSAAIDAGKSVLCEWPLGNGLAEAAKLAEMALAMNVHAAVGLQARSSPVVAYVRDLISQGHIGKVRSTNLVGSGGGWTGGSTQQVSAYLADKKNGATLLTIPFGHTVDALCWCLGEFASVSAVMANHAKTITIAETGETLPKTAEDQVSVSGILKSGAVATIHYRGGFTRGTNLVWEINGTEGDLLITADSGHAQMVDLRLQGARGDDKKLLPMPVPNQYRWSPPETPHGYPFNVAQAYVHLARDLSEGTHLVPSFDDAVLRHSLLDAIERAAATGQRQTVE